MTVRSIPALALRYLRTGFAFLIYGMTIGLHLSAGLHMSWDVYHVEYRSAHAHVILIGFGLMTFFGLALWRLPEPAPRTRAWIPRAAWWALTGSVVVRSTCEVAAAYGHARAFGAGIFACGWVQLVAVWALGAHLLARVRGATAA